VAEAASAEFAEHGYAGARTERIAQLAGVNKQLLYYYFGSKAGLYDGVMEAAARRLRDATDDSGTGHATAGEALRARLIAVFNVLTSSPNLARLLVRSTFDSGREAGERPARQLAAGVGRVISEGQGLGFFRDDVDPEIAARQAVVLIVGYLALEADLEDGPAEDRRTAWIQNACDLLVRSLSW
jgi:TetR/AcrR family transcriptional regulator